MNLAWFVADALDLAGLPRESWKDLAREEQIRILRAWQTHVGTAIDFVKKANFVDRIPIAPYPVTPLQPVRAVCPHCGQAMK